MDITKDEPPAEDLLAALGYGAAVWRLGAEGSGDLVELRRTPAGRVIPAFGGIEADVRALGDVDEGLAAVAASR